MEGPVQVTAALALSVPTPIPKSHHHPMQTCGQCFEVALTDPLAGGVADMQKMADCGCVQGELEPGPRAQPSDGQQGPSGQLEHCRCHTSLHSFPHAFRLTIQRPVGILQAWGTDSPSRRAVHPQTVLPHRLTLLMVWSRAPRDSGQCRRPALQPGVAQPSPVCGVLAGRRRALARDQVWQRHCGGLGVQCTRFCSPAPATGAALPYPVPQ